MERAWIIAIGTELTLGQSLDTNSAWLAQQLAAVGVRTTQHLTVADERPDIRAALEQAAAGAGVVLITGGLGPTDDDLTREVLAEALGAPLEQDPGALAQIEGFFASRGRKMPPQNAVQAQRPRGTTILPNLVGTAPGLRAEIRGVPVFCLPGVPFEMKAMYERHVRPALARAAKGRVLLARRLNCFGLGESEIGEKLRDLMRRGRNPEVGTTADLGTIGVRINAHGASADEATRLMDETEAEIRQRLGKSVFGRDQQSLADVVGQLLLERGQTLALAESCTGGLAAKFLTDVAGASRYFRGAAVAYSNEAKMRLLGVTLAQLAQHGAVSEVVAGAMAIGARTAFGSDCGVSITGIAGPDGGTPDKPVGLVCFGLSTPALTTTKTVRFGSDAPRFVIRERAARVALNLVRLALSE